MKAHIVNDTEKLMHDQKSIQILLNKIVKAFFAKKIRNKSLLKHKDITLVFLTSSQMKKINKNFRDKDKPTDVLSFVPIELNSLGELLFCADVLKKQAKEQGHSLDHEFLYMFIHGILHLLGYDHELSAQEEKLMFRIQDQLFHELTHSKINLDCLTYVNRNRT